MSIPPISETTSVIRIAKPTATPASVRPQAMKVENIASSPWAKLTIPVER